jgi:GT2 family glycosyltransferase
LLSGDRHGGDPYRRALVFARWHGEPLGSIETAIPAGGLAPSDLAAVIWDGLESEIGSRAEARGLALPPGLDAGGLPSAAPQAGPGRAVPATVVIATRDRPEMLERCLHSVLALDHGDFDVVVVDSAPATDEAALLLERRFRGAPVTYVREEEPGLARAHNRGIAAAHGAILAFTDDDVVVDPGWLSALAAPFDDPHVACVTGMIVPAALDTRAQWWLEGYAGFSKGYEPVVFDDNGHHPEEVLFPYTAGRFGSGANMAFRASVLREMGGFDPALGAGSLAHGGDDLAAFFDVVTAGHRLVYEPAAVVHHEHRREESSLDAQVFGYGAGLTAYLTKTILDRPARLAEMARRLPAAVRYALSPGSARNRGRAADFPARLRRRELLGMLAGPGAYLRSVHRVRRLEAGRR